MDIFIYFYLELEREERILVQSPAPSVAASILSSWGAASCKRLVSVVVVSEFAHS